MKGEVTCVSEGPAHTLFPCWYSTKNGAGSSLSHTPSIVGSAAARVMKSNGLNTIRRSILVISEGGRKVGLKSTPQKYSPYLCCAGPTYLNHALVTSKPIPCAQMLTVRCFVSSHQLYLITSAQRDSTQCGRFRLDAS